MDFAFVALRWLANCSAVDFVVVAVGGRTERSRLSWLLDVLVAAELVGVARRKLPPLLQQHATGNQETFEPVMRPRLGSLLLRRKHATNLRLHYSVAEPGSAMGGDCVPSSVEMNRPGGCDDAEWEDWRATWNSDRAIGSWRPSRKSNWMNCPRERTRWMWRLCSVVTSSF